MSLDITYIGHATAQIQSGDTSLITDPNFSDRIFWIKRRSPLTVDPGKIKQPSAILLSHAHYDHLDIRSYKYFSSKVPIITPPGLAPFLAKFIRNRIIELEPGASFDLSPNLRVKAFSVTHRGFRILPFRHTNCNGYLIEMGEKRVFFIGDSAYRTDFRNVSTDPMDAAILPISCYKPEWFMKWRHMNPEQAFQVFEEIGARYLIPTHWDAFHLGGEPFGEPIEWLKKISAHNGMQEQIQILQPGESFPLPERAPTESTLRVVK